MDEDKLLKFQKSLKDALDQATDGLTKKEFLSAFKLVTKYVVDIKDTNTLEFKAIHEAVKFLSKQVKDDATVDTETLKKEIQDELKKQIAAVDAKLSTIKNGEKPTNAELVALIEPLIPAAIVVDEDQIALAAEKKLEANLPTLGEAIRNALELLSGDDRLSIGAISGIEELVEQLKGVVKKGGGTVGWGAHPLTIQQSGTTKAKTVRTINFTGATVSVSPSGVVTVAVTGGSGWTIETPTGTVDSSNKTFTATATPKYIVVDGLTYFENDGYTLAGLVITTTVAPAGFIRSVY